MSRQRPTQPPQSTPPTVEPAQAPAETVEGLELSPVRSGDDVRRRGWFWHWNSVVTQYSPLIGLKGVGLLNSYTVWTDRRESSPHRGYAFPSQQSEADFYGEDRAELIAINKILVALDLIEIKKEMVLRIDEHGRRWRVPHNLYRVKDHDDRFSLTAADVLKVVELADREAAVYRHIRRVFSSRFAPIDPANVWHAILPEVREDPRWQRLAAKVAREEDRFSARTKAGHASRRASAELSAVNDGHAAAPGEPTPISQLTDVEDSPAPTRSSATSSPVSFLSMSDDSAAAQTAANDSNGNGGWGSGDTVVALTNTGMGIDVARSNSGSAETTTTVGATAVDRSNTEQPGSVAPSNTIEDQYTTTTTTTWAEASANQREAVSGVIPSAGIGTTEAASLPVTGTPTPVNTSVTTTPSSLSQLATDAAHGGAEAGHGRDAARRREEAEAIEAFEAANGGRPVTPAQMHLLRQLAARFDLPAWQAGDQDLATGWAWVVAAIYEAVEAGSSFVAPRRIREILTRWEREGLPGSEDRPEGESAQHTAAVLERAAVRRRRASAPASASTAGAVSTRGGNMELWTAVRAELARSIAPDRLETLTKGVQVLKANREEIVFGAPPTVAASLSGEYRGLLARAVGAALRRTVRVTIRSLDTEPQRTADPAAPVSIDIPEAARPGAGREVGGFEATAGMTPGHHDRDDSATGQGAIARGGIDAGGRTDGLGGSPAELRTAADRLDLPGIALAQLWAAVVDEVERSGEVSVASVRSWLRTASLTGQPASGRYVVVAPHDIARRRIETQLLPAVEDAFERVLGAAGWRLEVVTHRQPA